MNNQPSSYYFTFVVYPNEFSNIGLFYNLGSIFVSPIHNKEFKPFGYIGDFKPNGVNNPKPHIHVLVKCSNKITENAFIIRLCDVLKNDFKGVALHKGDCLVKNPQMMLRYFYHLDNPLKEHFNIELAFQEQFINFTEDIIKAFNTEISLRISFGITSGEIENLQQIMLLYPCSAITTKWLYTGKNMYVVNSLLNEQRRNERYGK